jgi:hypothetical protein
MAKFTTSEGRVYRDGIFQTAETSECLLAVLRRDALAGDWWAPFAAELAGELETAIRAANEPPHHSTRAA